MRWICSFILSVLVVSSLGVAADPEKLQMADGTAYDPSVANRLPAKDGPIGQAAWVTVAGYDYRAKPGSEAPKLLGGPTSAFMDRGFVWESKVIGTETFLLLSSVNNNGLIEQPFGWVPKTLVISKENPYALMVKYVDETTKKVFDTAVPRKGMIVNTLETVLKFQQNAPDPLFTLSHDSIKDSLGQGKLPESVAKKFTESGIALGQNNRIEPRTTKDGWIVTMEEKTQDGAFAARQQYELIVKGDTVEAREGQNMAWVHNRPVASRANRRKSFYLANVFFVFRELDGFTLIGSVGEVLDGTYSSSIHGWVESSRLSKWNTTEALEWDRRSTEKSATPRRPPLGMVFSREDDAKDWMISHAKAEQFMNADARKKADEIAAATVIAREGRVKDTDSNEFTSTLLTGMDMRYPLLGVQTKKNPTTQANVYGVGWFGDFIVEGGKKIDPTVVSARRAKILSIIKDLDTIELLFVIDGTGSTYNYRIGVVPDVIRDSLKSLDDLRRTNPDYANIRVRATIVLFGERKIATGEWEPYLSHSPLSNLQNGDKNPAEVVSSEIGDKAKDRIDQLTGWLRSHENLSKDGKAELEAVVDGLVNGIDKANFSSTARKFVIFLGDMGDKSQAANAAHNDIKLIRKNLEAAGKSEPINFIGIRLEDKGSSPNGAALLQTQLDAVVESVAGNANSTGVSAVAFALKGENQDDVKKLIQAKIQERIDALLKELKDQARETRDVAEGSQRSFASPVLRRHYESKGAKVSEIEASGVQIYEEGFAHESTFVGPQKVKQLRQVYLVPVEVAKSLRDTLLTITNEGKSVTTDPDDLRKLQLELLKGLTKTGGPGKGVPAAIADAFLVQAGLKFTTAFLKLPPDEIKEKMSDTDCKRLLLAGQRLNELLKDGEESQWITEDEKLPGGGAIPKAIKVANSTKKAERFYEFPYDTKRWVWLDQELHIP